MARLIRSGPQAQCPFALTQSQLMREGPLLHLQTPFTFAITQPHLGSDVCQIYIPGHTQGEGIISGADTRSRESWEPPRILLTPMSEPKCTHGSHAHPGDVKQKLPLSTLLLDGREPS